jgi:hypothetical protein
MTLVRSDQEMRVERNTVGAHVRFDQLHEFDPMPGREPTDRN